MSGQSNDGGPAYPHIFLDPQYGSGYKGMTLRDYFAGQALVGLLSMDAHPASTGDAAIDCAGTASRANAIADAMIAEREKGGAK